MSGKSPPVKLVWHESLIHWLAGVDPETRERGHPPELPETRSALIQVASAVLMATTSATSEARVGSRWVEEMTGVNRGVAARCLHFLEESGWLTWTERKVGQVKIYRILIPKDLGVENTSTPTATGVDEGVDKGVDRGVENGSTTPGTPGTPQENRYEGTESSRNGSSSQSGNRAPPKKTPPRENPRTPRQPDPYAWDELLSHFATEKRKGRGKHKVNVLCPTHDDDKPSLSIAKGDRGWKMWCHAGCDFNGITAAVGLDPVRMFFEHRHVDGQPQPKPVAKPEPEPVPDELSRYGQCLNCEAVVLDEECGCRSPDVGPITVAQARELGLGSEESSDPPSKDPDDWEVLDHRYSEPAVVTTRILPMELDEDCVDCPSETDQAIAELEDQGLLEPPF